MYFITDQSSKNTTRAGNMPMENSKITKMCFRVVGRIAYDEQIDLARGVLLLLEPCQSPPIVHWIVYLRNKRLPMNEGYFKEKREPSANTIFYHLYEKDCSRSLWSYIYSPLMLSHFSKFLSSYSKLIRKQLHYYYSSQIQRRWFSKQCWRFECQSFIFHMHFVRTIVYYTFLPIEWNSAVTCIPYKRQDLFGILQRNKLLWGPITQVWNITHIIFDTVVLLFLFPPGPHLLLSALLAVKAFQHYTYRSHSNIEFFRILHPLPQCKVPYILLLKSAKNPICATAPASRKSVLFSISGRTSLNSEP